MVLVCNSKSCPIGCSINSVRLERNKCAERLAEGNSEAEFRRTVGVNCISLVRLLQCWPCVSCVSRRYDRSKVKGQRSSETIYRAKQGV
jgi:hypothetical protein